MADTDDGDQVRGEHDEPTGEIEVDDDEDWDDAMRVFTSAHAYTSAHAFTSAHPAPTSAPVPARRVVDQRVVPTEVLDDKTEPWQLDKLAELETEVE